ncbi:PH domain-containing protein [Leucobacter triazinivorans]|nr:PH domain-containing protein [Leucobacter triazinivorans]
MNEEATEHQDAPPADTNGAAAAAWPTNGAEWQRVSPSYAWADLGLNMLLVLAVAAALVIVAVVGGSDVPPIPYIVLPTVIALLLVNALLAFRRVRAIGYILREDDLLFRRGILFERVIAVPYGRLQLVDVTRGPLLRALGLATLKFVTASAATGVHLPGLRFDEAEQLRDRLVELAETRRSGL